jgi:tryptophan 7-halogenase
MRIERLVIAGGGVAGWMTAAALARALRGAISSIIVVEAGDADISLGYPSLAEATLPSTPGFHRRLGLNENALLRAANGCFTTGRALSGWSGKPAPGFHPYGDVGASIGPVAFGQLVARRRREGLPVNMANYAIAALCAQTGRFARPPQDPRSVLSTMAYGLHLETSTYAAALKADALAHGVTRMHGAILGARVDESGCIAALITGSGIAVEGDFFIDCSGAPAKLIAEMLKVGFECWSAALPCNRIASSFQPSDGIAPPYTHVEAQNAGWQSSIALQSGTVQTRVFVASDSPDQPGASFKSGRRAAPWTANCVAIGGAAAVLDPVACTSLHLVHSAIERLIRFFPHARQAPVEAREYNRHTLEELDCTRDFAALHYRRNGRHDSSFWEAARSVAPSDRLAHKIALFESCGRTALHDGEVFEDADWISLFDILGVEPQRHDAAADAIPVAMIDAHLARLREVMLKAVATVPGHGDYIRQTCQAQQ